jgi:amidase
VAQRSAVDRRTFLGQAAVLTSAFAFSRKATASSEIGVEEVTLADLGQRLAAGAITARALTEACLARIDAFDRRGPELKAVIELNPEAFTIAEALDDELRTKGSRGPLHGIPILLKDNIGTADQMTTTAGSLALAGSKPQRDAFIAERLRAAGAVLLGKANLSEWANFRSTHASSGWSARGGQCRNPYALDRNPCGSSSGSAVAVAASLCPVAVGTETDGSIVCPSSVNGIVGIKPTLGLVSRSGIIPIAHSQDTAGPMARSVRDAAILLAALAGSDARDPATANAAHHALSDYTRLLDPEGLRGARLGVWRASVDVDPRVKGIFEETLAELKRRGAVLVDPVASKALRRMDDAELEVLLFEFKTDVEAHLRSLGPSTTVRSLSDLIAFNKAHAEREMSLFGQELFEQAQAKGPLTSLAYRQALATCRRLARREGLDALFAQHRLDALIAPTGGPAWLTDPVSGDHDTGIGFSTPAAVAGYPHITVPMGFVFGLPVGLSFVGLAWSEPTLLRLAYAFELATRARRAPQYRPTVQLPENR